MSTDNSPWTGTASAPRSSSRLIDLIRQIGVIRLIFGAIMLVVAANWAWGAISSTVNPVTTSGVGSCWEKVGSQVKAVHCGDSAADYRISQLVSTPEACATTSASGGVNYVQDSGRIGCLTRI